VPVRAHQRDVEARGGGAVGALVPRTGYPVEVPARDPRPADTLAAPLAAGAGTPKCRLRPSVAAWRADSAIFGPSEVSGGSRRISDVTPPTAPAPVDAAPVVAPHRGRHRKAPTAGALLDAGGALPLDGEVVSLDALAAVFGMTASGARRAVLRGEFGPYFRVGRAMFLRRTSILAALAAREVDPGPPPDAPPIPEAPAWARESLRPRRGPRK